MTNFYSRKRVGGITFISLGRLRFSYCVARAQQVPERPEMPARGLLLGLGCMGALYGFAALYIATAFYS